MRRLFVVPFAVLSALVVQSSVAAQDGSVPVVVFEGRGLGHGVGMPLDGANTLAAVEDGSADDILDRFYPGAARGSGDGLIRVLLAAREDLGEGIDLLLPDGGTVRDGRTTPVSHSFPIRVPAGSTVRLTYGNGFYRAEVLDERSISGTVEITPTSDAGATTTRPATPPPLATSERSLWVEPRQRGRLSVVPEPGTPEHVYRGLTEVLVEAERLHVVAELDVEEYLAGLDLAIPDGTSWEPAALEAAVVAARSYALRAAQAEQHVGRFHVYADERSLAYVGPDQAADATARAVRSTKGRIMTDDGEPIAALMSVSAGGATASPTEIFGRDAPELPYLAATEYSGEQEFSWRVDMELADVARRLGYTGDAGAVAVASTGPSGRPSALVVTGSAGDLRVPAPDFHTDLRLPSSRFEIRIESRADPLPAREDSPPFQELPGEPGDGDEASEVVAPDIDAGDENSLPRIVIMTTGAGLLLVLLVLLVARRRRRVPEP